MPRPLKPLKVDDVHSPDGYTRLDVFLDRDENNFYVEVVPGDKESRVTADLANDVKKLARATLAGQFDQSLDALFT